MSDEEKKRRKDTPGVKDLHRAETYAFCSTHNRRYPQGGKCPSCVAEAKKKQI